MNSIIRDVQIDNQIWNYHKVVLITLVPNEQVLVTVHSTMENGDDFIEKSYELPWNDNVVLDDIYESVWELPELQEYVDVLEVLDDVLDILTDEQAEQVPQVFPEWEIAKAYDVGKRVRYNSKLYRCVQAHISQVGWEPDTTAALWVRTAQDDEIPEWTQPTGSHDAYSTGDKVTHNNKTWISTIDANVYEPGVYGWNEVS